MSSLNRRLIGMFVLAAMPVAGALAQESGESPFVAEVTAHTLMVRSGPSQNYYVVAKLDAGDRVTVTGEDHGWYRILPPDGCYSLVSKNYVDLDRDGKAGVVNANALRVRAGSDIERHRYAVQLKLDRGAEVIVLGETPDGYLKIEPPEGAYLWISADYVAPVPGERLALDARRNAAAQRPAAAEVEEPSPAAGETDTPVQPSVERSELVQSATPEEVTSPTEAKENADKAVAQTDSATSATPAETTAADAEPPSQYLVMLDETDADLDAELSKPPTERNFDSLLKRYREIAAQEYDEVARLCAERRITQLQYGAEAAKAIETVRDLSSDVAQSRRDALAARSKLHRVRSPIERGFDAKGELRESMVYSSTPGPRRYRLVDPKLGVPRTLCYVEIPQDSDIDVSRYLGRVVGIRARNKYLQTGDVDPITIVVAERIVPLEKTAEGDVLELGPEEDTPNAADAAPGDSVKPQDENKVASIDSPAHRP